MTIEDNQSTAVDNDGDKVDTTPVTPPADEVVDKTDDKDQKTDDTPNPDDVEVTLTQGKINQMIGLARSKARTEKIEERAAELNKELTDRITELEGKVTAAETSASEIKRENDSLVLSNEFGVPAETLLKTKLTGDELREFAKDLGGRFTTPPAQTTVSNILNDAVNRGNKKKDWRDDLADQLTRGRN